MCRNAGARFATFPPDTRATPVVAMTPKGKLQADMSQSHLKTPSFEYFRWIQQTFVQPDTILFKVFHFYSVVVSPTGDMKAHGSEVGVFVRIKPSAQDLIECLPDGQVSKTLSSSARTELNPCNSQILAFKDVCFCLFG